MAVIVLVHGAWGTPPELAPVEPALRAAGHEVINVDLPCLYPDATLNDYADSVMDAISEVAPDQNIMLVGHSFGGATISLVRERRPDVALVFVTAVALTPGQSLLDLLLGVDPFDDPTKADPWGAFEGLVVDGEPGMCELNLEAMASAAPPEQRAEVHAQLVATQRPQGIAALREGWPGLELPTGRITYVVASNDTLIPPDLQREMARSLGADIYEVASDHEMFAEQTDQLATILAALAIALDH
jgi:pimeloyl-ACP methyl ester carboxylesterase